MKFLNCTNHSATFKQKAMGIIDPSEDDAALLHDAITYNEVPDSEKIKKTCTIIIDLVTKYQCDGAMIGGALFLIREEEETLFSHDYCAAYAFTKRVVKEEMLLDGSVRKTSIFDSNETIVKHPDGTIQIISFSE